MVPTPPFAKESFTIQTAAFIVLQITHDPAGKRSSGQRHDEGESDGSCRFVPLY